MRPGAELLFDEPMARRGRLLFAELAEKRPPEVDVTADYVGDRNLLVLYGVGLAKRLEHRQRHLAAGGHVAMWDLAYWDREGAMRLAIDSLHPTAAQLARAPAKERFRPMALREDADPAGPILLIGIGPKSGAMFGLDPCEWERAKVAELRARFPGRTICWRPKGKLFVGLPGTLPRFGSTIDVALRGCSLVVCRHSNVAVDACIAGIPVECEDGAAAALYNARPAPTREERIEFLKQLAWWNWGFAEAREAWSWMQRMTE